MFNKKRDRAPHWIEVALAAFFSLILGVAAAIVLLALKPVAKVGAIPKDAPASAIYYIEGNRNFDRTPEVEAKRKRFLAGDTIAMQEGEINVFLGATAQNSTAPDPKKPAPPPPKDGDKPPAPDKMIDVGQLNCRIDKSIIQFGVPVTFSAFGIVEPIIVQTSGGFEKRGAIYVYVPDTVYFGGCPVIRVPFLREFVLSRLLFNQPVPNDLYNAWTKLASVTLDGNTLHLRMP